MSKGFPILFCSDQIQIQGTTGLTVRSVLLDSHVPGDGESNSSLLLTQPHCWPAGSSSRGAVTPFSQPLESFQEYFCSLNVFNSHFLMGNLETKKIALR